MQSCRTGGTVGTSLSLTLGDTVLRVVSWCPVGAVQPASKPCAPAAVPLLEVHSTGTKNLSECPPGGAALLGGFLVALCIALGCRGQQGKRHCNPGPSCTAACPKQGFAGWQGQPAAGN